MLAIYVFMVIEKLQLMRMVHVVCIIHVTWEIAVTLALHMQGNIVSSRVWVHRNG